MTRTQKYRIQVKIQEKRIGNSLNHRIWIRKFYKQWYVKEDSHNGAYRTNIGSEHYGCTEDKHWTSEMRSQMRSQETWSKNQNT